MEILGSMSFEEVVGIFNKEHSPLKSHQANTNKWGLRNLREANELSSGSWKKIRITHGEVLAIALPWHAGEDGRIELIPKEGMTVRQAAEKLKKIQDEYARSNPSCWQKIMRMKEEPIGSIFLSSELLHNEDYKDSTVHSNLVHLDGLHRLLSKELFGKFDPDSTIEAFLARKD